MSSPNNILVQSIVTKRILVLIRVCSQTLFAS